MIYAVGSDDFPGNSIGVLNTSDDTISNEFESNFLESLSISPDRSQLFGVAGNSLYSLPLPLVQAPLVIPLGYQEVNSLIGYSADDSTVYVSTENGQLSYLDPLSVATGQQVNQYGFSGNQLYGSTAVLSPDTTNLFFATYQGYSETPSVIEVLNTATFSGQPITGSVPGYNPIAVSSDGKKLFIEPITYSNNVPSSSGVSLLDLTTGEYCSYPQLPDADLPFGSSFILGPKNIALYALTQDASGNLTFTAFNPATLATISTYALDQIAVHSLFRRMRHTRLSRSISPGASWISTCQA